MKRGKVVRAAAGGYECGMKVDGKPRRTPRFRDDLRDARQTLRFNLIPNQVPVKNLRHEIRLS